MDAFNIHFTRIEILIVKYLFKHYRDKYNPRQLAKILNINHAHANKLCKLLLEKGLLVKEELGNSAFYYYNYDSKIAIKFMEYLLSLEEKEFPKWLIILLHNLQKFKGHIEMGLVFGSSINSKNYNDIDVLLMYIPKNLKKVKIVKEEIRKSGLNEKPIRYVEIDEKDIIKNKDDKIFYSILSNSLIFHNMEKYVEVIKKCRN